MAFKVKHEFVVVPRERCAALDEQVDELRRAEVKVREIAFDALPAFYHSLSSWRALAHHLLPGARRSWSLDALAANLGAALGARGGGDWSWLDSTASLLGPEETTLAAASLAALVRDPEGPLATVMEGLSRAHRLSDGQRAEWSKLVAAELARPDGDEHGEPGEFVALLRNLCAAVYDAATRDAGLLYLNYSPALIPA